MFARLKSLFPTKRLSSADESSASKKQGDEHLKLGRLDDAARCYRHALSINPGYVDACVGLGFVLGEQKQYKDAEHYLQHALSIVPEIADAHYILGTIAKNQDDQVNAIDCFNRALAFKPDFELAHRDLLEALFLTGQLQKAKDAVDRAISVYPESAEFQFYLGHLLAQEGAYDPAIACYQKALSIQPGSAQTHKNLADVMRMRGELDQAATSYQKALWFEPDLFDAHIGLGSVMQSQGKLDQALECYERALTFKPDYAPARLSLGNVLESLGRSDEAIACYRSAIALEPELVAAHNYLGNALKVRGATQEAVACYQEVVRLDSENPIRHLLAALSGRDSDRAPSDYIERLFDQYAHKFDSDLVQALNYSVPEKLANLLRPCSDPKGEKWIILDLGCGTGLSGAAVAPFARQLVGVDLSTKMLDKARERNLYHRLEHLDLLTMMQGEAAASYDVVFAADVFVYLGKLDELMNQAQRLLRPGGHFAFSVESLEALTDDAVGLSDRRDYCLNVTGRYAHSIAYLGRMAAHNGFDVLSTTETQSRLDKGKPVQGYLVLWRRPPA